MQEAPKYVVLISPYISPISPLYLPEQEAPKYVVRPMRALESSLLKAPHPTPTPKP